MSYCSVRHIEILWQNQHDRGMKYNLTSREFTSPPRRRGYFLVPTGQHGSCAHFPRLRFGRVLVGLALAILMASGSVPSASAQQRSKRSGYGTNLNAARTESGNTTAAPAGRAGEGEPLPAPLTAEEKDGNQLVALAARDVFRQQGIEAKVKQRVFAFGQEVVGAGEYYQFGSGQPKLLRLDMKMQVGPQAATLLQICGRQNYWIRRQVPPADARLEHVNLTRLASALSRPDEDGNHLPSDHWILLGGLSRLVESLHRNFDFASPRHARLGGMPVLVVQGRLKPERFRSMQAAGDAKKEVPSEQTPTAVTLTLGRADQLPPHFPYRIEFLRQLTTPELQAANKVALEGNQPVTKTHLSILEFDEVRASIDLDPRLFEFEPGDEESEDKTQTWLRKLQE
jgi:hypothetical protein